MKNTEHMTERDTFLREHAEWVESHHRDIDAKRHRTINLVWDPDTRQYVDVPDGETYIDVFGPTDPVARFVPMPHRDDPVVDPDATDSARISRVVPDAFDARKYVRVRTRTRRGKTGTIVRSRSTSPVIGSIDIDANGDPVHPVVAAMARLELDSVLRSSQSGAYQSATLDAIAERLFDVDPLVGTEGLSWHAVVDGMANARDDDVDADPTDHPHDGLLRMSRHIAADPYRAAIAVGAIDPRSFHIVRDAVDHRLPIGKRRTRKHPTRYRLRVPTPRSAEIDAGLAAETINDDGTRSVRWVGRVDGSRTECIGPWVDASRMWVGHRLIDRDPVKRSTSTTGRRVARARVDTTDWRAAITNLAVGESVAFTRRDIDGDPVRISVTRTPDRYRMVVTTGPTGDRSTRKTERVDVSAIIDAAAAIIDATD